MSCIMIACECFVIFPLIVPLPQAITASEREGFNWKKPVYLSAGQSSPPPGPNPQLNKASSVFGSLSLALPLSTHLFIRPLENIPSFTQAFLFCLKQDAFWEFFAFSEPSSFSMSVFVCICVSWSLREFLVSRNFLAFLPHGRDGKWKLTTVKLLAGIRQQAQAFASTLTCVWVCVFECACGKYGHTRWYSLPGKAWCTWRKTHGQRRRTFCLRRAERNITN